jgi:hypothetical protein
MKPCLSRLPKCDHFKTWMICNTTLNFMLYIIEIINPLGIVSLQYTGIFGVRQPATLPVTYFSFNIYEE